MLSDPPPPIAWPTTMMCDCDDQQACIFFGVDYAVWEAPQDHPSRAAQVWATVGGERLDSLDRPLNFFNEGSPKPSFDAVVILSCVEKLVACCWEKWKFSHL
nr:hypothetical protein [uncultured bacterium]